VAAEGGLGGVSFGSIEFGAVPGHFGRQGGGEGPDYTGYPRQKRHGTQLTGDLSIVIYLVMVHRSFLAVNSSSVGIPAVKNCA